MNILIDVGHPAQVHLFKNFAWILEKKGNRVFFTARDKECCLYLLEKYGFKHSSLGKLKPGFLQKIQSLPSFIAKTFAISKEIKPDLLLSHGSISLAFVSRLIKKPHISMEDTGNAEQIFFYKPFTDAILSPESLKINLGKRHIKYKGYHELAYLHPKYFHPEAEVLNSLGIKETEKFVIVRFSGKTATHDFGFKGIPCAYKAKAVSEFSKYAKVFVLSEVPLEESLKKFQVNIPPEKMHDLLSYAALVYTDGAKTACEAALLGVPSIYLDFKGRDYAREQEKKYGTMFNFKDSPEEYDNSIKKGIELLLTPDIKQQWEEKRKNVLQDNIDVTAFIVWFAENYPKSFEIVKADSEYQFNFK